MAYTTVYKGFIFIEGGEPTARVLGKIEYKKALTYNSQLKGLEVVKDQLVEKAAALGANAIIEFKYGQKSLGWFKSSLLGLDDNIKWYGDGYAAILPEFKVEEIMKQKS